MTDLSRFFLRLRRRLLHGYELLLYALLLSLAVGVIQAAASGTGTAAPAHCGNTQSSSGV